jgi:hypothetical protein
LPGFASLTGEYPAMLTSIKLLHTAIWFCMATSIVYLPFAGLARQFRVAWILTAVILAECSILALNHGRCPLTDLAAHYTTERVDNFDIYLPMWLARYNKEIFGSLFLAGEAVVIWRRMAKR